MYNFISILTHETYILCQEATGSCRVQCLPFADSGIKKRRSLKQHFTNSFTSCTVSAFNDISSLTVSHLSSQLSDVN